VGTAEAGGGRRWKLCSGELAARSGQQARGGLRGIQGRVGAARIGSEIGRSQGFTVGTKAAAMVAWWLGARGIARGGELDSFYRRLCLGEWVTAWRKGGVRRDGQWQPRGGVARVRRCERGRRRSTAVRP
jgi:hypothetical protein